MDTPDTPDDTTRSSRPLHAAPSPAPGGPDTTGDAADLRGTRPVLDSADGTATRGGPHGEKRPRERRRGPVVLRRGQIESETMDQRLLDSRGPADWVHMDPWRVMRIQAEFVEGFGMLAELGPAVSVFGSARTPRDSAEYRQGIAVGRALAEAGFAVITGGGPGSMEAANRGASEGHGVSVGLGIELPFEQGLNQWVDVGIHLRYFFVRKTLFVKYADGFIVLPGGFGTMDELFEALTLVQTHKVTSFPVVLLGTRYWGGLVSWLRDTMVADGKASAPDLELFTVTDDIDEAVAAVTTGNGERRRLEVAAMDAKASAESRAATGIDSWPAARGSS